MKDHLFVDKHEIVKRYKPVDRCTHKGLQGHALIVGGSYGKMGSIVLSSKACLKTGAGLVTAFVPRCGHDILQISNPEVMVIADDGNKKIKNIDFDFTPKVIGIGMGMGQEKETQKAFHDFLKNNATPLVIDADALNILSKNKGWLSLLPKSTVLTPHHKELERLIGSWKSEEEKIEKVKNFSSKHQLVIVVKGAPTHIVYQDFTYENTTGNQALATAGSGDVLTGIITGLISQSYAPIDAAIMGVYLHGMTADIAYPETGYHSFIASDIITNLGEAFCHITT